MKEGDRVKVFLDKEIKKAKSGKKKYRVGPTLLRFWEAINGKYGVITEIISNNEIWVMGEKTKRERVFNKNTLKITD